MKVFISHSRLDNNLAEIIVELLEKYNVQYWVDFEQLETGDLMTKKINEGLSKSTDFLLLWTTNAVESKWVMYERDAAMEYENQRKIVYKLDNIPVQAPYASFVRPGVKRNNLREETEILLAKSTDIKTQIALYYKKIASDYEELPKEPNRPIISNFRKFDGAKYYIEQGYLNLKTKESGTKIVETVLALVEQNLIRIKRVKELREKLTSTIKDLDEIEGYGEYRDIIESNNSQDDIRRILVSQSKLTSSAKEIVLRTIHEKAELDKKKQSLRFHRRRRKNKSTYGRLEGIPVIEELEKEIETSQSSICNLENMTDDPSKRELLKIETILQQIMFSRDLIEVALQTKIEIENNSHEKLIPIVGDYGSGKSALCHCVLYQLVKSANLDYIVIFIPLGQLRKDHHSDDDIKSNILEFVRSEYSLSITSEKFDELIHEGKILFILDALDEMSQKLDNVVAQQNLSNVLKLSKDCVTILTSRHTYLDQQMQEKLLFQYDGLIKIRDFSPEQIERAVQLYLHKDERKIKEVLKVVREENHQELARKPLFLYVICTNFHNLKDYFPINEAIILKVLTEAWIKHDVLTKRDLTNKARSKTVTERQRISEILAVAQYEKNKTIAIGDIQAEVMKEFQYDDSLAIDRLSIYYKDAINSTFLVREENETYRFILNPVLEYFVARRVVSDIKFGRRTDLLKHINLFKSLETFNFLKGIIDVEWAVKPHVFADKDNFSPRELNKLRKYENTSKFVVELIEDLREDIISDNKDTLERPNIRNIMKLLHVTKNIPPKINLSGGFDLSGIDLSSSNLDKIDISHSNLDDAVLRGSILVNSRLVKAKLRKTKLTGADLTGADLTGADLTGADLNNTNLSNTTLTETKLRDSNLSYSNLSASTFKNTDISGSDLAYANLSGVDLTQANLYQTIFSNTTLQVAKIGENLKDAILLNTNLAKCNFRDFDLSGCDIRGANLTNAIFYKTILKKANLRDCKLIHCDLTKCDLTDADLSFCDLDGTDFTFSTITGTRFHKVKNLSTSENEIRARGGII